MIVNLDEYIDLGLRREPWNGGTSNMLYGNQFIAKGRSDEWLVCQKAGGPSGVVGSDLAGQCHFRSLVAST